jgi:hypothetical protein
MTPLVPVDGKGLDWPRKVANAINSLLRPQPGAVRYEDGALQYYDGEAWQLVP